MSVVDDPSTSILGTALVMLFAIAGTAVLALTGLRGLWRLPVALLAGGERGLLAANLAASAGLASVAGAALAVQFGGPGALVWLWIAALLGMGVAWIEAWLAHRGPGGDDAAAGDASPLRARFRGLGAAAPLFAGAHALALAVAAIGVGALLHGHQVAAIAREVAGVEPWAVSLALALVAAPLVLGTGPKGQALRGPLLRVIPIAVGLYVLVALAVVVADAPAAAAALRRALGAAFAADAARGGLAAGAVVGLTHAVLRAVMTGVGMGVTGLSPELAGARDREAAAARSMLTPAIALAVVGTLSALPILTQPTLAQGTGERAAIAEPGLVPLEAHHARGLLPSERGQTFILPRDTPLAEGKRYAMVLRADPRGHKLGQLLRDENMIALPHWQIAGRTDTVIFRPSDRRLAQNPGYDVVVPCVREVAAAPSGREYLKLTPRDPKVSFRALINALDLDGPYLVVDDYVFEGAVERAVSGRPGIGEHLALYQPADAQAASDAQNPTLRALLAAGMRGPYLAGDEPPLPDALVAAEGFTPEIGELLHLRLEAPARGLELGFMNRTHELETPAWDFLAAADTAILRHRTDPALDLRVPVHSRLTGDRLRFSSALPGLDFADLAAITSHEGPYLLPPPYAFTVEVHGGVRLPEALRRRRTLIPLDGDPKAAPLPRHPPLAEVLGSGMEGPFLDADGAGALAVAWRQTLGGGAWAPALAALLLALLGLWAWAGVGARAARDLLGDGADGAYRLLFLGLCALAGGAGLLGLLDVVDVSVVVAGQLALLALITLLPQALTGGRRR